MRFKKSLLAYTLGALMLVGCSSSDSSSQSSSAVAQCTITTQDIKIDYQLIAPSEEAEIDEINLNVIAPFDMIRELLGISSQALSDAQIKETFSQMESSYIEMVASLFGLPKDDINIQLENTQAVFTVKISDVKAFQENPQSGLSGTSLVFKDAVAEMEDQGFACD